jgi:hypothetical protein
MSGAAGSAQNLFSLTKGRTVPKNGSFNAKPAQPEVGWTIVGRQKYLLLVAMGRRMMQVRFKPLRLKGKPRYSVPPDCDPNMW